MSQRMDTFPAARLDESAGDSTSGSRGRLGLRLLEVGAFLAVCYALYAALVLSPPERVQGEVFRIIYVHVPMGWLMYGAFFATFVASGAYLWKRRRTADQIAHAAAEVGVVLTTLVLLSGMIWARPVWGVWWTWDARLTTTLVLWFIYVGYLMVRSAISDPDRSARIAAVIGVVGFLNVPVVQLSVNWWRTLHPQPSVTSGGLTGEMWTVLLTALAAFALVAVRLVILRVQLLRTEAEARRLALRAAEEGA